MIVYNIHGNKFQSMISSEVILNSAVMGGEWLSNTSKTNISPSLKPSGRRLKRFGKENVGVAG